MTSVIKGIEHREGEAVDACWECEEGAKVSGEARGPVTDLSM
jgi:hypothetical protein